MDSREQGRTDGACAQTGLGASSLPGPLGFTDLDSIPNSLFVAASVFNCMLLSSNMTRKIYSNSYAQRAGKNILVEGDDFSRKIATFVGGEQWRSFRRFSFLGKY